MNEIFILFNLQSSLNFWIYKEQKREWKITSDIPPYMGMNIYFSWIFP